MVGNRPLGLMAVYSGSLTLSSGTDMASYGRESSSKMMRIFEELRPARPQSLMCLSCEAMFTIGFQA